MGYLSGLNNLHMITSKAKLDPLRNLENGNDIFRSIETRCGNNREGDLSDAVTSIFLELLGTGKIR